MQMEIIYWAHRLHRCKGWYFQSFWHLFLFLHAFSRINPITGAVEEEQPDPMEGMTEEQKEYEAMKLISMFDKLSRSVKATHDIHKHILCNRAYLFNVNLQIKLLPMCFKMYLVHFKLTHIKLHLPLQHKCDPAHAAWRGWYDERDNAWGPLYTWPQSPDQCGWAS